MQINNVLRKLWASELLKIEPNEVITSPDKAAILLSANMDSFPRYEKMDAFALLFESLGKELNKYNLQNAQAGVLGALSALKIRKDELLLNLYILLNEKLLKKEYFEAICEFLDTLDFRDLRLENEAQSSFHKSLESLNALSDEIALLGDETINERVKKARQSANEANFNIALSGVINAGKSSLLNALIEEDLLGVSNIPQTASICVLKYSKEPYAKVEFWDKIEQENLGLPPKELSTKQIALNELKNYTSAESELAKYVKLCTLGVSAKILEDINIIDTPGIDDAIKAREELSANYLKNCDATLYLMNSGQSATAKDMEFLKSIVQNTKNSEIIVLLTHIDKLGADERLSVLEYTKKAIKNELGEAFDIKFFLTSATANIGINELKAYLLQSFFEGSGKKTEIILEGFKKELNFSLALMHEKNDELLRTFNQEGKKLLEKSKELEEQNQKIIEQISLANKTCDEIIKSIESEKIDIANDAKNIASKTSDRIINDLRYAKMSKKSVDFDRVWQICLLGLNDFMIDLLREKKQSLEARLEGFSLSLEGLLRGFSFDLKSFKSQLEQGAFGFDFSPLKENIKNITKNSDDLELKSTKLKQEISDFLASLGIEAKIKELLNDSTKSFNTQISARLEALKQSLEENSKALKSALDDATQGGDEARQKCQKASQILQKVEELKQRLEQC